MPSSTRSLLIVLASVCLAFAHSAAASEHRRLLDTKAREVKAVAEVAEAESRELWINPAAKPTATVGWNVIITIISNGKFTTVNNIKLRTAISKLGFPTNSANFQFGGNAATTNWRSITAFVVNIPTAKSSASAIAAVQNKVTVNALNSIAGLPKANPVVQVTLSSFKA